MRGKGRTVLLVILVGLAALLPVFAVSAPPATPGKVDFARDIRPILSDKCFACHGPDEKHREADLRLDTREGVFEHSEELSIVAPRQPEQSELWRRITSDDDDTRMPPADSGKTLTQHQRELIRQWIEEGAEWRVHWAFERLVRPDVPNPRIEYQEFNTVDRFVLERLQREGIKPSPAADPRTLIRRYSFDLIGQPPSWQEVEAFLAEYERDPDRACSELVDRLLASPHFGERLAIYWLDLVRYADTVGYHGDQEHAISPYRDYVIQAFNDNMPFDRFTTEQLAGDLLPDATIDQRVATGYNRVLQTSHEGGVQQKEYLAKYSADRVRNFGSVWLGVTMGCCECHDHKYDPFPQRDFYRLAAFFADIDDLRSFKGVDVTPTKREPEMKVLSLQDRRQLEKLQAELQALSSESSSGANAARMEELKLQIEAMEKRSRRTMITVAIEPRPIRVLERGDWMDETGEIVEPGVPAVFPQIRTEGRATRLDLARWLVSKDHPLTARVFVNRLWKLYFGRGLAASLEDVGSQGVAPTHPELLDWLACEFVDSGWDIKYLIRLLVLSRTYRQSSFEQSELQRIDPENQLLARQSRPRHDAELIRDNVLAVSGLLVRDIGGPSSRPYQPDGYYDQLNFPKRKYQVDRNEQQYRRGVYTHWQRSFLHPMLKSFDAPSREECCAERPTSNTPQAALVLLNDPTFLEAARTFAARIMLEGGSSVEEQLQWAWRTALSREPNERELASLQRLFEQDLSEIQADPASADALLTIGMAPVPDGIDRLTLAAWTSVARTLFNLNEFITRN